MNNLGDVKAVFPVQVWRQSWSHCEPSAPSRRAGATQQDRLGCVLCPRGKLISSISSQQF